MEEGSDEGFPKDRGLVPKRGECVIDMRTTGVRGLKPI